MTSTDQERLVSLETHAAHQDALIDDLNTTITAQWETIERLQRDVQRLQARLADLERQPSRGEGTEPPPPHY